MKNRPQSTKKTRLGLTKLDWVVQETELHPEKTRLGLTKVDWVVLQTELHAQKTQLGGQKKFPAPAENSVPWGRRGLSCPKSSAVAAGDQK